MNQSAMRELESIKQELNSIIREIEDIENGVRCDFQGIGNDVCADRLQLFLNEKLYKAKNRLNNVDTSKVAEGYETN